MVHRIFGIRHHGPGSAHSLRAALQSFAPDIVLVEGPPDAEPVLGLVADADMRPPVALLVHVVDEPRLGAFYPFAVFSPEWQALRYAHDRSVPARFMDLPCAHQFALAKQGRGDDESSSDQELHEDPIGLLAEAAGFSDREQWWDVQVEQRTEAEGLFEAIQEAMAELRAGRALHDFEAKREAYMRTCIRIAHKDGYQRIAVVCGAWHAPALAELGGAKQDSEQLRALPKVKVASTWIPWTHSRLAFRSGYGAGVESPGWYAHVWLHRERAPLVWAVLAARLLRDDGLDASSANVIETVRLAEALAVIRELPAPGLNELRESLLSVLCGGERAPLRLIRDKLEIGEQLGSVPEGAPSVPVQRDFEKQARSLRMKLTSDHVALELDLRKDGDRERSRLLHRLRVLGVEWGEPLPVGRTSGTFRESWRVAWDPEFAVELVAANRYGNTVLAAAQGKLRERAARANLAELAAMVELSLLADLPEVMTDLLAELDARAAHASDVRLLLDSTEPLAHVIRYGDVRGTRAPALAAVFRTMLERALVGLVPASSQLDDDAAGALLLSLNRGHGASLLLDDPALRDDWLSTLRDLLDAEAAHPRLRGRACRLLVEQERVTREELGSRASLFLSRAAEPGAGARWLEGLVAGEGLFLVHQEELVAVLDSWLAALDANVFQAELPLLRRAFAGFPAAERRAIGQKIRGLGKPRKPRASGAPADHDALRAARVLPVLARVLGVHHG